MRITKDPTERKAEILDVAEDLFAQKGYEATSVREIVKRVGVAQGLFYYYFKSKSEVLNAVVERLSDNFFQEISSTYNDPKMNAVQKLNRIVFDSIDIGRGKESFIRLLHQEEYEPLHQRISASILEKLSLIILDIVKQGIGERVFELENPEETVEFLLAGMDHYLNKAARFYYGQPEYDEKIRIVMRIMEKALGAKAGTFNLSYRLSGE